MYIRQGGPEGLQDHVPVLLSYDLVPDPAGRKDGLLSDGLDFRQDLPAFSLQDALKDLDTIVDYI